MEAERSCVSMETDKQSATLIHPQRTVGHDAQRKSQENLVALIAVEQIPSRVAPGASEDDPSRPFASSMESDLAAVNQRPSRP